MWGSSSAQGSNSRRTSFIKNPKKSGDFFGFFVIIYSLLEYLGYGLYNNSDSADGSVCVSADLLLHFKRGQKPDSDVFRLFGLCTVHAESQIND